MKEGYGDFLYLFNDEQERLVICEELPELAESYSSDKFNTTIFAGGCFWGVEAVFEQLYGVLYVESGYSGGSEATANYSDVS